MDELLQFNDVDNDGYLSRDEFSRYVRSTLSGMESCPSVQEGTSLAFISYAQKLQLLNWTNGTDLELLYTASRWRFNISEWVAAIAQRTDLLVVARTRFRGNLFGGFTGEARAPNWNDDSYSELSNNSFVFNLNDIKMWGTDKIDYFVDFKTWENSAEEDFINFGASLAFGYNERNTLIAKHYPYLYYQGPTPEEIGFPTSDRWMVIDAIEVYQVTY